MKHYPMCLILTSMLIFSFVSAQMTVKDNDSNVLMQVNDEGIV